MSSQLKEILKVNLDKTAENMGRNSKERPT